MNSCKNCGKKIDLMEIKRIYGLESSVFYGGFCSARCFTKAQLKKFDKNSK